jgi:erythromycin esterase-like protein
MLRLFSMKYVLCAALCTWFCPDAFTQDIEKYVRTNITTITTIDTLSDNYDDLTDIGKAIGDARVVMLGEQDHGDAPTFLAKTRLVKYLHEKKGFNVLAFESDFYGLTSGWDNTVKQPDSIRHFLKRNIFMIWTYSDACQYLFNTYIPATFQRKEPLAIAGFDSQMYLDYSFSELTKDLNKYLTKAKLIDGFADSRTYRRFLDAV